MDKKLNLENMTKYTFWAKKNYLNDLVITLKKIPRGIINLLEKLSNQQCGIN